MRKTVFAIALAMIPTAGFAQSQLDRMETVSETMTEALAVMMVRQMEANGADAAPLMDVLPDMAWDAEMREAGRCILDRYSEIVGDDGVESMLTKMEAFTAEFEALRERGGSIDDMPEPDGMMPEGLTEQRSMEITQACGMMELQMRRMDESGFSDAMMNAAQ